MRTFARGVRRRMPQLVLGVVVGLLVGGASFAVAVQATTHGGPKPRFHDAGACDLVDTGSLEGNWTHGDYVSAVAKADPSKVSEAAKSDCGKPVKGAKNNQNKSKVKPSKPAKPTPQGKQNQSSPRPKPSKTRPAPKPTPSITISPSNPVESPTPLPS